MAPAGSAPHLTISPFDSPICPPQKSGSLPREDGLATGPAIPQWPVHRHLQPYLPPIL